MPRRHPSPQPPARPPPDRRRAKTAVPRPARPKPSPEAKEGAGEGRSAEGAALKEHMQQRRVETFNRDADRYALVDFGRSGADLKFVLLHVADQKSLTVRVREKGRFGCNCSDFRFRCAKSGVNCKHVIYALTRILRLPLDFAPNNLVADWARLEAALANIRINYDSQAFVDPKLVVAADKVFGADDVCPICYLEITDDERPHLVGCTLCKGVVHVGCMMAWLKNAANKACVYCRDPTIGRLLLAEKGKPRR